MKKTRFFYLLLMMALAVPVATSCGGDDDDEQNSNNEGYEMNKWRSGVHRLDISFTGDINNWMIDELGFSAVDKDGGLVPMRDLNSDAGYTNFIGIYRTDDIRNYSFESKDGAYGLHGGVKLKKTNPEAKKVTVKFVFSVNGDKLNQFEYETNPDYLRTIMDVHGYYVPANPVTYDNYDI